MARQSETKKKKPGITTCAVCQFGPPAWQYKCPECGHKFQMPAPKGPSEEKKRTCPKCHSQNIKRVNIVKSEACPPGG
jgi:DNA-directed RNA polymerase subunit RPC12/RpoP